MKEYGFFDSFSSDGCGYGPLAKIMSIDDLCTLVVFSSGGFDIGDGVYGYYDGVVNTDVVVGGCMMGVVTWWVVDMVGREDWLVGGLLLWCFGAVLYFPRLVKG